MKKLLIVVLSVTFVFGMLTLAFGSGNNTPLWSTSNSSSPHGGYSASSNKCKDCHAVHEADSTNPYKLLRTLTTGDISGACNFCHNYTSGIVSTELVYRWAYSDNDDSEHQIGETVLPDDTSPSWGLGADGALDCRDCHRAAPHGKGAQTNDRLTTIASLSGLTDDTAVNNFCDNCHDNNYKTVTSTTSHIIRAGGPEFTRAVADGTTQTVAYSNTSNCADCHSAPKLGAGGDMPHSATTGGAFLGTGSSGEVDLDLLDNKCIACHQSGGDGVGFDF